MSRVAVIGDVAGHLDELRAELARLGADPRTGRLPEGLTVVQVGDLVHRGPDSDGVIALIDGYLTDQPGQWVQLVGNHEAHYLRRPVFEWSERIAQSSIRTLRRWWAEGRMVAAHPLTAGGEDFLLTHAGLTAAFWREVLGSPSGARETADALNGLAGHGEAALFRPGQMLRGLRPDPRVGPLWAAATTELLPSWLETGLPFSQIHGHTSAFDWQRERFRAPHALSRLTEVDTSVKHETTRLTGGRIIGIDPGHGRRPQRPWRAWEASTP